MKTLFLIRHCRAVGQEAEAPLTAEGEQQAHALANALATAGIERIVSSPMRRALASAAPLARRLGLSVEVDARLAERVLSGSARADWLDRLRESFDDLDARLEGGESSREAMARGAAMVDDALRHPARVTALVTHGNLLALLLRRFDAAYGFDAWRAFTNPDVFRVTVGDSGTSGRVERMWQV
jgi:2,3-bisphosphoglycerate-dependent phosphoglycerate mutase